MKTYTTLAGARRATHRSPCPIIRVLVDGSDDIFIPVSFNTTIMAVDRQTGQADGSITMLELSTNSRRG